MKQVKLIIIYLLSLIIIQSLFLHTFTGIRRHATFTWSYGGVCSDNRIDKIWSSVTLDKRIMFEKNLYVIFDMYNLTRNNHGKIIFHLIDSLEQNVDRTMKMYMDAAINLTCSIDPIIDYGVRLIDNQIGTWTLTPTKSTKYLTKYRSDIYTIHDVRSYSVQNMSFQVSYSINYRDTIIRHIDVQVTISHRDLFEKHMYLLVEKLKYGKGKMIRHIAHSIEMNMASKINTKLQPLMKTNYTYVHQYVDQIVNEIMIFPDSYSLKNLLTKN